MASLSVGLCAPHQKSLATNRDRRSYAIDMNFSGIGYTKVLNNFGTVERIDYMIPR